MRTSGAASAIIYATREVFHSNIRLKICRTPGVSLEAAARDERYRIFATLEADYVVLAQHLDYQAETLMLQLLQLRV